MRRFISLVLSSCVLLTLAGCHKPLKAPVDTTSTQVESVPIRDHTLPTIPDIDTPMQIPMISVSMPIIREPELAKDGTEIFNYIYQNMSLILPEQEIADRIIVDFLNRIDKTAVDAEAIKTAAKTDYTNGNRTPYLCQITYEPMRIDSGVLSLFGRYATYSGSSHPDSVELSVNYNLLTGHVMQLDAIIDPTHKSMLVFEIIQALNRQKEEKYLFEDFENIVKDRFASDFSHENDWYFSNTGLCFYFSAYDIAPYSSGVIVAEIPYERLTGLMNDAYFPAERMDAKGTLSASLFHDNLLDDFDTFSEVILDKGSAKALLHTDSIIYDVRIEIGSWTADGSAFIPEYTVYAANALSSGDAIVVESEIPDTLPHLRINYRSNGKTVSYFLTDSGNDGGILLIQG